MYIVRNDDGYVSLGPIQDYEKEKQVDPYLFCIGFVWTFDKADAVRFASRWHAKAVARALRKSGRSPVVIRVSA